MEGVVGLVALDVECVMEKSIDSCKYCYILLGPF